MPKPTIFDPIFDKRSVDEPRTIANLRSVYSHVSETERVVRNVETHTARIENDVAHLREEVRLLTDALERFNELIERLTHGRNIV